MKIKSEDNSRLVPFYEEKLQKICRFEITDIYISYYGYLCIECSSGLYLTTTLHMILNCPKHIINLLMDNDINKITLALNLL
jgi:hypothetical protein